MDSSKTAFKVREQLRGFLGIFSPRFSRPIAQFIGQKVYGIQAAQDVKLSQIGRELHESIPIGKVENRLSRNLALKGMDETLHGCLLDYSAQRIQKDTLIIIDPSDIQKDYAEKMPYLAKVWDGSKGRPGDKLGYSGCMAVACESGARRMTPLMFRLWSSEAPGFRSENTEVEAVIDMSQRIHEVPENFYYAIADGIRRLFTRFGMGWRHAKEKPPDPMEERQMLLSLCFAPG